MPKRSAKKRTGPTDASMCCSNAISARTQNPLIPKCCNNHTVWAMTHITGRHIYCVFGSRLILLGECQHDIPTWRIFGSPAVCRLTCWLYLLQTRERSICRKRILKMIDQMTFLSDFFSVSTVQNVRRGSSGSSGSNGFMQAQHDLQSNPRQSVEKDEMRHN